jgi:hypothetical protein
VGPEIDTTGGTMAAPAQQAAQLLHFAWCGDCLQPLP